jgi:hypothetical protein
MVNHALFWDLFIHIPIVEHLCCWFSTMCSLNSPRPHTGGYTYMMCCWFYTMYTIKQWKICTNQKNLNMRFKYCDLRRVTFFKLDHKSKMANITGQCSTMGICLHIVLNQQHIMYVQPSVWCRGKSSDCTLC